MLKWQQKDTEVFSRYVATQFALGRKLSLWEEKLCGHRWHIIGVMNFWLCFALAVVIFVFYIFPKQCKRAPAYVEIFLKPIPISLAVLPPVGIWIGLIVVDNYFPFISPSTLLVLLLAGLSIKAGIQYVNNLKQRVPNRNLLVVQQKNTVPSRTVLNKAATLSSDDSSSEQ